MSKIPSCRTCWNWEWHGAWGYCNKPGNPPKQETKIEHYCDDFRSLRKGDNPGEQFKKV